MTARAKSNLVSVIIPFIVFTTIWGSTWIVIRDQLTSVPAFWSVTYRFTIAAAAMAVLARVRGESLRIGRKGLIAAAWIGLFQFTINFNFVYLAERHITSGLVATVFALLLIPNTMLAWALLGQRPSLSFLCWSVPAIGGVMLLFAHELAQHPAQSGEIMLGIALTLLGVVGASAGNVLQAREQVRAYPLFALLAWAMAFGAAGDIVLALLFSGPPVFEARVGYVAGLLYLALAASALAFSLYFPVIRKIGPAKAAYSSVLVPLIAMSISTWVEGYRWTPLTITGVLLALGGMVGALNTSRTKAVVPDAG
jgi:drug/metabolite transporter (DMT)-like permease